MQIANCTKARIASAARAQRLRRGARRRQGIELRLRDEIRPASLPGKVRTRDACCWSLLQTKWPQQLEMPRRKMRRIIRAACAGGQSRLAPAEECLSR